MKRMFTASHAMQLQLPVFAIEVHTGVSARDKPQTVCEFGRGKNVEEAHKVQKSDQDV